MIRNDSKHSSAGYCAQQVVQLIIFLRCCASNVCDSCEHFFLQVPGCFFFSHFFSAFEEVFFSEQKTKQLEEVVLRPVYSYYLGRSLRTTKTRTNYLYELVISFNLLWAVRIVMHREQCAGKEARY